TLFANRTSPTSWRKPFGPVSADATGQSFLTTKIAFCATKLLHCATRAGRTNCEMCRDAALGGGCWLSAAGVEGAFSLLVACVFCTLSRARNAGKGEFFQSWYFIGIMAGVLVALVGLLPFFRNHPPS